MSDEEYMSDIEEYFDDDNEMDEDEEGRPCLAPLCDPLTLLLFHRY